MSDSAKQAIAGVSPASTAEASVMTVFPSVAKFGLGRALGLAYENQAGAYIFRLGNLIALMSIPIALGLYFLRIAPGLGVRYRLTNRRIVVLRGIRGVEVKSIELDRFDSIDIVVQPGQAWYDAGDLVFKSGVIEKFRLEGVSRPGAFRAACQKSHAAYVGVKRSLERQASRAAVAV